MHNQQLIQDDGHIIETYEWHIQNPRGLVHINHGMAEHALRYRTLAHFLNNAGFSVVAHNHRGHGPQHQGELAGHYADENGWQKVLADVHTVRNSCNPNQVPYILFGHSMGSFIAQAYAISHPPVDALILSGSNWQTPLLYKVGGLTARFEKWRQGPRNNSQLLNRLSFGSFNNAFKPTRTEFDWLSADNAQVDLYIQDPYCGFDCTTQLWIDLLAGLTTISTADALKVLPENLPVYLFAGQLDPVGRQGKGMQALEKRLRMTGHRNVTLTLYKQGRHEMLNEVNKQAVMLNIANWLVLQFPTQTSAIPLNGVKHGCLS